MTASMTATWQGPFSPVALYAPERPNPGGHVKVGASGSIVVLTTTASQMAVGDPTWWSFGP